MKDKLVNLLYMYTIPLIAAAAFSFKDIQFNGEYIGTLGNIAVGFVIGMAIEGVFLVLAATVAVLSGKFD